MGRINSLSPSRNQKFCDKFCPLPNCLKSVLCEGEIGDPKEKSTSGCITVNFPKINFYISFYIQDRMLIQFSFVGYKLSSINSLVTVFLSV